MKKLIFKKLSVEFSEKTRVITEIRRTWFSESGSAPLSKSNWTNFVCWFWEARCRGVFPVTSLASRSVSFVKSSRATSLWPLSHATWRAVRHSCGTRNVWVVLCVFIKIYYKRPHVFASLEHLVVFRNNIYESLQVYWNNLEIKRLNNLVVELCALTLSKQDY